MTQYILLGLNGIAFSLNIVMIDYYQSIEKAALSKFHTLLRGMIILVPAFIILPLVIIIPTSRGVLNGMKNTRPAA